MGADRWLVELPALVEHLEDVWRLRIGRTYDDATEAFVCEAVLDNDVLAVLKLLIPRDTQAAHNEIAVLRLANGEGCAQLLKDDEARGALLIECLGPTLHSLGLPIEQRHEVLCSTAQRLWRPAAESGLPTGRQKADWLVQFVTTTWDALDHPCSERAIEHALWCADRRHRAYDEERAVLVHGDVHQWNTLVAGEGYKLIDPDGLLAEAEYDLGVIMREDPLELLVGSPYDRARWLARRCGLDAVAIWEWGVIERVSTGLLATQVGLAPWGAQMLEVADTISIPKFDDVL